ncbi:uncharacterized protein LDX57_001623 [Aspergillus melleus]|uniref:uncharacterized protein n=1 Tax=Aspergillus melleus TaxID=138277 RepID=UPI001E8EBF6B|nr:uncharacterized protein LDX57_001623 [Aspergillus melleus]KAH8423871.1 hypothetical protein LDX57_001623 [Aspergillus melleus]
MVAMSEGSRNKSCWEQVRHYADHQGRPVVLEQYVEPDWTPDPSHLVPIQVYSVELLDPDHEYLRDYLLHTFCNDEFLPLFEVHSYCPPDAFDCMEHNRREIAHRKQQHRSEVSNPPGLCSCARSRKICERSRRLLLHDRL